jgi:excinuclease ABC subunit A
MGLPRLRVVGAREHNLKNACVDIPRDALTVITGLSGSGKSSLAFDTIYAEGRRRYIESMSSFARQFLDRLERPDVDLIEGLSPSISIEQKTVSRNPRSTVGTVTEIYDHLRVLFAVAGTPHCAVCGAELSGQTPRQIADRIMAWPEGTRVILLAPLARGRKGAWRKELDDALARGFVRAKIDGVYVRLDEPLELNVRKKHDIALVVDRLVVHPGDRARFEAAIDRALDTAKDYVVADVLDWSDGPAAPSGRAKSQPPENFPGAGEKLYSLTLACPDHGPQIAEMAPRVFSFNSPHGACPACQGVGSIASPDPERIVPDPSKSLDEGAIASWSLKSLAPAEDVLDRVYREKEIDSSAPWRDLSEEDQQFLLFGEWRPAPSSSKKRQTGHFLGAAADIAERLKSLGGDSAEDNSASGGEDDDSETSLLDDLRPFLGRKPCPACHGARLKPEALAVKIRGRSIADYARLPVDEAAEVFGSIQWGPRELEIGEQAIKEINERLGFLKQVGVGYLSLDRTSGSLAGGEAQRIRLASQIGSELSGVLYVLDEPSIGLHMRDHERLLGALARLRDLGNTIVVVEHDEATMRAADYLVDLGPGAGRLGGEVIAAGPPEEALKSERSLTAAYLRGDICVAVPAERRQPNEARGGLLRLVSAREHNLDNLTVEFPLGVFICVTGVSGSGKSTLVNDVLTRALARALGYLAPPPGLHERLEGFESLKRLSEVDQTPIGRTPRSNIATYSGLFNVIRDLFAAMPESQARGYGKGRFSFNVKGGRCERCKGAGHLKIAMAFLPDALVRCEECHGRRYNDETLQVLYKGKSIADALDMTVEQALTFFDAIPTAKRHLETLMSVGLDYIHLGQPAPALSGGEAQRAKLARELAKRHANKTFYVLDEPTTGLHFDDTRKLIEALQRLVDEGNTVCVIEHNMDVIKSADWVIDLGPEGGSAGGKIVAQGTPEQVAQAPESHTGRYLRDVLS